VAQAVWVGTFTKGIIGINHGLHHLGMMEEWGLDLSWTHGESHEGHGVGRGNYTRELGLEWERVFRQVCSCRIPIQKLILLEPGFATISAITQTAIGSAEGID
jgi:hypothetical protein